MYKYDNELFVRSTEMNDDSTPESYWRKQNRTNVSAENVLKYYRRVVLLRFLDICMAQLHKRFLNYSHQNCRCRTLIQQPKIH